MKHFTCTVIFVLFVLNALYSQEGDKPSPQCMDERTTGFYTVTSFSMNPFGGPFLNGCRAVFGYRWNRHIGLGGGIGLERYVNMPLYKELEANLSMMPVFADIRYTVLKTKVSPVIAVNGGYTVLLNIPSTNQIYYFEEVFPGMAWNEYYDYDTYDRGGWFLSAEAGVKLRIDKRFALYLAADYSAWQVAGTRHSWLYQYLPGASGTNEKIYHSTQYATAYVHSFLIRIGFIF